MGVRAGSAASQRLGDKQIYLHGGHDQLLVPRWIHTAPQLCVTPGRNSGILMAGLQKMGSPSEKHRPPR